MKYKVVMSDHVKDERITLEVEAQNVFDAVDLVAGMVANPEETELIEAIPMPGE